MSDLSDVGERHQTLSLPGKLLRSPSLVASASQEDQCLISGETPMY
jgi:hypothetical protein